MPTLSLSFRAAPTQTASTSDVPPKFDWPLMSDVSTIRAGVPEALIHWRRAKKEALPSPCDPDV